MIHTNCDRLYQVCTRCVMDTTAIDITFDSEGLCNYCRQFLEKHSHTLFKNEEERSQEREHFLAAVRASGRGRKYDCVVGLSGGADSSWALYQVVQFGLRPLAVHMDNGWDSELSQNNIENLVRKLGVDLYTYVINWEEFRDLQQAFFDADVVDIELLTDNALAGVNYQQAAKYGVKYILSGTNHATEGMVMPPAWSWLKHDKRNIYGIWKAYGNGRRICTFPAFGTFDLLYYRLLRGIRWVSFLDYMDYHKAKAIEILQRDLGYRPYPYKHYESVFTRFYQGYLLPHKFGADKRLLHLSTLIVSGQMTRQEALAILEKIPYPSEKELEEDMEYFLKKMGWSQEQLNDYIARPPKPHDLYPSEKGMRTFLKKMTSFR